MHSRKIWRVAAVVFALGLAGTLVSTAVAATTITRSARTLTRVKLVHSNTGTSTTSPTWVDVPGAATSITVPSCGRSTCAVILARFSAQAVCANSRCWVRILINGKEADPTGGVIFDVHSNSEGITKHIATHGIEQSRAYFTPGTYPVKVQYRVDTSAGFIEFNFSTLVVETLTT
jgi:hypothetical protein